ncbi:MAG: site-2 protease family protein [Clostridia bacterium]|nr:site-2 protease family protein [Clostridia bacterium]
MGKLKVSVHPLFFLFGLYFAAIGKVFSFLVFTLTALIHEAGHAFAAEKSGYMLENVTLMPYGAVISGDIDGLKLKDEIKIVAAGPLINLLLGTVFVALWWIFPACYPYTELAATANFSLCIINLLPAYPLDGGRFLLAALTIKAGRKRALSIARISGLVLAGAMLLIFAFTAFSDFNPSLFFFSLFMLVGATDIKKERAYISAFPAFSVSSLSRGKEIKTIAVTADFTVKKLYALFDGDNVYRVVVYRADGRSVTLEPQEVARLPLEKGLYGKII